ncbi:serine hydrolase domain-containing protein [Anaerovorax sp. IOR16]|uniref:serine hydrolase domain-containing protein n=1 Tax=Anaerovorax sp. IOR16 TaxID=2773458 RepID=UPI0019D214F8|nr:serine hydrolase domain-containing protein [Anaerovorax sp. IOR16]
MEEMKKILNQLMKDAMQEYSLPGLVLGIKIGESSKIVPSEFVYTGAAGYRNFETKEKMEVDQIFHMASITKLFVGTSIMQLWEKKLLSLDEKLVEIFPELENSQEMFKKITIKHLLTHTSGLSNVKDFGWDKPEIGEKALREYAVSTEVKNIEFLCSPDDLEFNYSDVGYELLGAIIEIKTGMNIEAYIKKNIFEPLGMNDSTLLTFERTFVLPEIMESIHKNKSILKSSDFIKNNILSLKNLSNVGLAMPHKRNEKDTIILESNYPYNRPHGPSSTLTSNFFDMEKFVESHLNHITGRRNVPSLLKPDTYEMIWRKYAIVPNNGEHIGMSWFIREQNGYTLYGHEGTDDGFRASFWICPQLDISILVNSNITKAPVKRIAKKAFELVFSKL